MVEWELDQFYKWVRAASNLSCPQSPSSNCRNQEPHTATSRGWLAVKGLCAIPGWTICQRRPEHRHTAATGFRIMCQPSLINSTFSVHILALSRRLKCPGRPRKLLNLEKMAQLSQVPPESKCASFSLLLSSCYAPCFICLAAEMAERSEESQL